MCLHMIGWLIVVIVTVYPFFLRSPCFRGWPSVHENIMTAKSANWSKLRKVILTTMKHKGLQGRMDYMYTIHTSTLYNVYVIGSLLYESVFHRNVNICEYYTQKGIGPVSLSLNPQKQYLRLYLKSANCENRSNAKIRWTWRKTGYTVLVLCRIKNIIVIPAVNVARDIFWLEVSLIS